jgi:glycosyltransferase involved in cell wall biosynthesis
MIIGIDYRLANSSNRGMARYCREIVVSLITLDKKNKYILYFDSKLSDESRNIIERSDNFSLKDINISNYILGEQLILSLFALKDKLDILWCPYNTFPLFLRRKCRLFVTIHDLIFLSPPLGKESIRQKIGRLYRKSCVLLGKKRIDICFTVSEYSDNQIKTMLKITNVYITYNCISTFYNLVKQVNSHPHKRDDFYFTVSGDTPSKNLYFLLGIFKKYLLSDYLIVAGVKQNSHLRKNISGNITFLNEGITDSTLALYYSTCKAFILPSLQEGFGIPVLEALVCNAPVIASNRTSIPEIVGDFGLLFDPTSEESLLDSIRNIDSLHFSELKKCQHIEKFLDWNTTALQVMKNFNQ